MARFDRYILRLLMLHFGFFGLVLVLVYWINRAVGLFDQLIANGESAGVFLELSMLMLPLVISIVLPVAAFIASVFVTNRLSAESELVVAQAAGYGPFRLARPVFVFGVFAGLFIAVLSHVLVPMSQQRLAQRQAEISQNITSRFLTEGSFVHPSDGITIYIRDITPEGELNDVFLSDVRNPDRRFTYSAQRAFILKAEAGPRLVMLDGLAQVLDTETQRLTLTGFEDFTYDLAALTDTELFAARTTWHLFTPDLLRASPALLAETGATRAEFLYEAHARTARALLALVAALTGFSVLLMGAFSRFGLWRQIVAAVVLLALLASLDNTFGGIAAGDERLTLIVYLPSLLGIAINAFLLWLSGQMPRFARRARTRTAGVAA